MCREKYRPSLEFKWRIETEICNFMDFTLISLSWYCMALSCNDILKVHTASVGPKSGKQVLDLTSCFPFE